MKYNLLALLLLSVSIMSSCDDNTDDLGSSLIDNMDHLEIKVDTFEISGVKSIAADSVLSRSTVGYLGKVRDPETGAYITSDFTTQFHSLENYEFPDKKEVLAASKDKRIEADSCEIRLYYNNYYGDSLATMKVSANELSTPMSEGKNYYSNYNPSELLRKTDRLTSSKVFTLKDLTDESSSSNNYMPSIRIRLDKKYTDKNGKTYKNFGTYIMQKYYEDSTLFKNAYTFIHNVVPGFNIRTESGLGSMAYISITQLLVYYKMHTTFDKDTTINGNDVTIKKDTIVNVSSSFAGTEEVVQQTRVQNDKVTLSKLIEDNTCAYLKTPAGIFTEMTLPVDEVMSGHERDTLNTAKIVLTRLNNRIQSKYVLGIPKTLLIIPKGEIYSFFEKRKIADYKTSFLAAFDSNKNTYTFNNISSLIKYLYTNKSSLGKEWNKVVIIPVTATYNTTSSTQKLVKIEHDMSMSSTRIVGGENNPNGKVVMSVIYSKFK